MKSLWNINQEIRYVFVQCLVPWCFINLISMCFKNKLTDPGALPNMPYAQRSPGQINLSKNTRRHVHSSAYLTLPWFHHPPANSRGGKNTYTLCGFRMGKKSKLQGRSKTFHHGHFQTYVPYILQGKAEDSRMVYTTVNKLMATCQSSKFDLAM